MNPTPVLSWDTTRDEWLNARKHGIGASDVAALLGFIPRWRTPWQLWAQKLGHLPEDSGNESAQLGTDLEPWLIGYAPRLIGTEVTRTPHMLYAHSEHPWRQCSPDAFAYNGDLVETKTAKIGPSWGDPEGWEDGGTPLAYEFQARWQMHVMDRDRVHIVALVAGMGVILRTLTRDMSIEHDLVTQVSAWRERHIVEGIEPGVEAYDIAALTKRYPAPSGDILNLDGTDALELCLAYKEANAAESAAKKAKDEIKAKLQAMLGDNTAGKLDDRLLVTWDLRRNKVDWERMATDIATASGTPLPDPDSYRPTPGRTLLVK